MSRIRTALEIQFLQFRISETMQVWSWSVPSGVTRMTRRSYCTEELGLQKELCGFCLRRLLICVPVNRSQTNWWVSSDLFPKTAPLLANVQFTECCSFFRHAAEPHQHRVSHSSSFLSSIFLTERPSWLLPQETEGRWVCMIVYVMFLLRVLEVRWVWRCVVLHSPNLLFHFHFKKA